MSRLPRFVQDARAVILRDRREDEARERLTDQGVLLGKRANRHLPNGQRVITQWDALADVMVLAGREVRRWGPMDRALRELGDPLALTGGFAGLSYKPLSDALGNVSITVANTQLWAATTYTPVFSATDPERAPVHYSNYYAATVAFGATLTTFTMNATVGTAIGTTWTGAATGNTPTSGTGYFINRGELSIYGTGSGTDARCNAMFRFEGKLATAGVGAVDTNQIYGGSSLTFNSQAANGLFISETASAAFGTIAGISLLWASWN